MAVLDSCAIIEILSGSPLGVRIQERFGEDATQSTGLSINEVLIGFNNMQRETGDRFFHRLEILSFDEEAAYKSVEIEDSLRKKGRMVEKNDIVIAAICLVHSLPIITTDKGFRNVDGLEVWCVE